MRVKLYKGTYYCNDCNVFQISRQMYSDVPKYFLGEGGIKKVDSCENV